MCQLLFIVWRKGIEALLVVNILYAWLKSGDAKTRCGLPYLWVGVGAGVLATVALAAVQAFLMEILTVDVRDHFQTAMVLCASILTVRMVLFGPTFRSEMKRLLAADARRSKRGRVALLSALVMAREGVEAMVLLQGFGIGQWDHVSQIRAVANGLALAFVTFYVLQLGGKWLSWHHFLGVTGVALLCLGSGLFQTGIDRLIDWELLPAIADHVWASSALPDDSGELGALVATLTGYRAHPTLMNLIAFAAYWGIVSLMALRMSRRGCPIRAV